MKTQLGCVVLAILSIGLSAVAQETAPIPASGTITGSGTLHYVPAFTGKATIGNSKIFQATTGDVGIGTTSPGATLDVNGAVNASTSFNLGGTPFAFGSLANGNAFVGFAGNSTMTGQYNTGSGYALPSNTTGSYNTAFGYAALQYNTTGNYNQASGYAALAYDTTGYDNSANGYAALDSNTIGSGDTACGSKALQLNTTGNRNTASGFYALYNNTTSNDNTASGAYALFNNTTGSYNTALGYYAGPDSSSTGLSYATAIGAGAVVSQNNTLVLGGPLGSGANVNVGIGTATPSNVFTIAQGAGPAIADGWSTYSSRRFKTNIQPLAGALQKVTQMQGVSYERKSDGKQEIGVIAEDINRVLPEVVARDPKTNEIQGVDYARLSALLIEAVKAQQIEIDQLKAQVRNLASKP